MLARGARGRGEILSRVTRAFSFPFPFLAPATQANKGQIFIKKDNKKDNEAIVLSFWALAHRQHEGRSSDEGLSYLVFWSIKFVNKEVENSNEILIKSVRELKRFPYLGGGFTSQ